MAPYSSTLAQIFSASLIAFFLPQMFPLKGHAFRLLSLACGGALIGVFVLDLIPLIPTGLGTNARVLLGLLFIGSLLLHRFIHPSHVHGRGAHRHSHKEPLFFLTFAVIHAVSDAVFFALAFSFSPVWARGLFLSLLLHKVSESLFISPVLRSMACSRKQFIFLSAIYLFSFPVAVGLCTVLRGPLMSRWAHTDIYQGATHLFAFSLVGLLSCLVMDLLVPSLTGSWKHRLQHFGWLGAGVAASFLLNRILVLA